MQDDYEILERTDIAAKIILRRTLPTSAQDVYIKPVFCLFLYSLTISNCDWSCSRDVENGHTASRKIAVRAAI